MNDERDSGPFLCARCRATFAQAGACALHDDAPLLDTREPAVREHLGRRDLWRKRWLFACCVAPLALLGLSIGVAVAAFLHPWLVELQEVGVLVRSPGSFAARAELLIVGFWASFGVGFGRALAARLHRPRYGRWSGGEA